MLKKYFIMLFLFFLLLSSTCFGIDITPGQFKELTEVLRSYTTLTSELRVTLEQQNRTLETLSLKSKTQAKTIQQLSQSYQTLSEQTRDFESYFKKYKKIMQIKLYVSYGITGVLTLAVIYTMLFK